MIKTVADLLNEILDREKKILDEQIKSDGITHRPTIGDMFENLTQDVLRTALPIDGLVVTGGFIETDAGLGPELDCILARTAGRPVSRTDKQIFDIDDVLAVIQVKRTLYKAQIDEGFQNLASVLKPNIKQGIAKNKIHQVFKQITGRPVPEDVESLPPLEKAIWHTVVVELGWPTRILLGFDGYANENTFRKGLVDYLTEKQGLFGGGVLALPSLILGGNASAIKGVGLPWSSPVIDGWWQFLGTTSTIPAAHLFLESIWTRLVLSGYADDRLFGEDLESEVFHAFLDARMQDECKGWELRYDEISLQPETDPVAFEPWTPHFVSHEAFVVAHMLCMEGKVSKCGLETDELKAGANESEELRLVGPTFENGDLLELTTERLGCLILPDGRYTVGEDNSGRLTRWTLNFLKARRQGEASDVALNEEMQAEQ